MFKCKKVGCGISNSDILFSYYDVNILTSALFILYVLPLQKSLTDNVFELGNSTTTPLAKNSVGFPFL